MTRRVLTDRRGALAWLGAGALAGPLLSIPMVIPAQAQGSGGTLPDARQAPPAFPREREPARHKPGGQAVDLNLVLAVDASGSVSWKRFGLQRQGYVEAFTSTGVLDAIRSGPNGSIAAMMFQWTGPHLLADVVAWTRIHDEASMRGFSTAIANADRRLFGGGTSISGAIDHGVAKLAESPFPGIRRVIDVSGDGYNNRGRMVTSARDEAVAKGININGLPILEIEPDLETYFRDNVIGGPGAFVVAAQTFEDFGRAILRKLILEISHGPAHDDATRQA